MKTAARILVGILLVILFLGCNLTERDFSLKQVDSPDNDKGALTLMFNGSLLSAKTLTPDIEMVVSSYDVVGTLEGGGDSFQTSIGVNDSFSQSGLTPGLWTISVYAKNAVGIIIGDGGTTTQINAGSSTTVQIQISPLSGNGTLELIIQWPKQALDNEEIVSTITPPIPPDYVSTLDFTIEKHAQLDTGTSLNSAIPAGYYFLTLRLIGDGVIGNSVTVWGIAEAVRILSGETTQKTYTYTPPN